MKFDKDTAVKHRFWLLLGGAVAMLVIALVFLVFLVPGTTAQEKKAVNTRWKKITEFKEFKNERFVKLAQERADKIKEQEVRVWKEAWDSQRDLMSWPKAFEDKFHFQDGDFALEIAIQPASAKLSELPEDDDKKGLFHGELKDFEQDKIVVAGRKGKTMTIRRTADVKIAGEDKTSSLRFQDLKPLTGNVLAVTYQTGKYFNDTLSNDQEQSDYTNAYYDQLKDIVLEAGPFNELGEPVVQFKDWAWKKDDVWKKDELIPKEAKFFRRVVNQWDATRDISEEAWMAQEDLWVQRELYRLVKKANDYVAHFTKTSKAGDKTTVFVNFYWNLELTPAAGKKVHVKITNNTDRRQRIDMGLLVQLQKDGKYVLLPRLDGLPVAPKGTKDAKGKSLDTFEQDVDLPGAAPQGIVGVRQVLTWETAAVRRIDWVSLGAASATEWSHSHRTAIKPPVAYKANPAAAKEDVEKKPDPPRPIPGEGLGLDPGSTPNKLIRDRYLEVTPQYRRMPVGMVLIVDQDHVGRVQTAFADSTLRLLMTQIIMNRFPGTVRPPEPVVAVGALGQPLPPTFPPKIAPGDILIDRIGSPGSTSAGGDDQEANVELVIYGVVSLYERFPPRAVGAGCWQLAIQSRARSKRLSEGRLLRARL